MRVRGFVAGLFIMVLACAEPNSAIPRGYVEIPPGVFLMGTPLDEAWRGDDEGPVHEVRITRPLYVKITEVTQAEWAEVMGENPANLPACGPTCPINNVRFIQAIDYLNRLSDREKLQRCYRGAGDGIKLTSLDCDGYRLPTEAEWAYFARAGTTGMTYAGTLTSSACQPLDATLDRIAWYCGNAEVNYAGCYNLGWTRGPSCAGIHPVGLKAPNPWGLYDILGNCWEWTNDWYSADYFTKSPAVDPLGPDTGTQRVIRSGGWFYHAWTVRVGRRYHLRLDDPLHPNIGIRPVRTAL
jgi:formylglycine-generating enzyme required for sulfatase activity